MTNQLLKTLAAGLLFGAALYFIPFFFVGKVIFWLIVVFLFFRLFRKHRYYRGPYGWQYADRIRTMSDDEYQSFKDRFQAGCYKTHSENPKNEEKS